MHSFLCRVRLFGWVALLIGFVVAACSTPPPSASDPVTVAEHASGAVTIDPLPPIKKLDSTQPQPPAAGVRTLFTVTLMRFTDSEAMDIIDAMRRFPGYESDEPVKTADISEYRYWSTETPGNLYEWLHDLLRVRYAVGENVIIQLQDTTIEILNKESRFR